MIHLDISAASQPGLKREHNEDMILIDTETYRDTYTQRSFDIDAATPLIIAVADGLGGHNAGEVASEDAARELGAHVAALPMTLSAEELQDDLEQWFLSEHDYLKQEGIIHPEQYGMATTLAAILFYRDHIYLINCGDSRVYIYDGDIRQLSNDHSLYVLTHDPQDAHVITNCLGSGANVFIDFTDITEQIANAKQCATLLLCSDGLTDMLTDSEIAATLAVANTAQALIEATYAAGARDNVSVIIATLNADSNV